MRIAISGASNAGKTTLVRRLGQKYPNWKVIHEIASTFDRQTRNTPLIQRMILEKQIAAEQSINSYNVLMDRCVIDNIVYCWMASETATFDDCLYLIDRHMRTRPYDLVVFIDEIFPLIDNGLRNMDPVEQRRTFRALSLILPSLCNAYSIPLMRVVGHTSDRIRLIEQKVREMRSFDP